MQTSDFLGLQLSEQKDNVNNDVIMNNFRTVEKKLKEHNELFSGLLKVHVGTYEGDGSEERIIDLGFAPKAVFVWQNGVRPYYESDNGSVVARSGLAYKDAPAFIPYPGSDNSYIYLAVAENGFKVYYKYYIYSDYGTIKQACTNNSNTYHYIAFEE